MRRLWVLTLGTSLGLAAGSSLRVYANSNPKLECAWRIKAFMDRHGKSPDFKAAYQVSGNYLVTSTADGGVQIHSMATDQSITLSGPNLNCSGTPGKSKTDLLLAGHLESLRDLTTDTDPNLSADLKELTGFCSQVSTKEVRFEACALAKNLKMKIAACAAAASGAGTGADRGSGSGVRN